MKQRLAILFLGLMLIAGNVWAEPDGIWKNTTGTPAYSFYVQTYVGNAMLVIVAPSTEVFWVFLDADDDYTNGFSAAQDLGGGANSLSITFTSDNSALANMTLTGQLPATYNLARNAQAPASGGGGNPPTGTLASPTNGQTVAGSLTITGSAADDVGLDRVGISIGGGAEVNASLNTGTGAFSYTWITTLVSDGSYSIVVRVYDTEGLNALIANINVTVNNASSPPVGDAPTLLTPANGATISVPENMTWADVGASSYNVTLCTDNSCNSVIPSGDWEIAGTGTLLNYASVGWTYYWRVRAIWGGGSFGPWSTIWSFYVANPVSDRNLKENFGDVQGGDVLAKLADLPVSRWSYKKDKAKTRHMGPMAQDFHAAFGLGDDRTIFTLDGSGVAFAAIQEMNRKIEAQSTRIKELEKTNNELRGTLELLLTREKKEPR